MCLNKIVFNINSNELKNISIQRRQNKYIFGYGIKMKQF